METLLANGAATRNSVLGTRNFMMKHIILALFVLWLLSLQFYLYVPGVISVALGAAFVSATSVAVLDWLYRRRGNAVDVDGHGSLGL